MGTRERQDRVTMVVLVRGDTEIARWPLAGPPCSPTTPPPPPPLMTLALVDHLARLQLVARRLGFAIWLHQAPARLVELLALFGMTDVIPTEPARADPAPTDSA